MRCLMCAAEMYVTQVVQDGTMPVPGFEHHTLECLECGDIERRLVFTREKTQPISPSYRRKKESLRVMASQPRLGPSVTLKNRQGGGQDLSGTIAQRLNLEHEIHHTVSKLCILAFEPLK